MQRHHMQQPVVRRQAAMRQHAARIVHQPAMAQQHALGMAGAAGGEQQQRRRVRRQRRRTGGFAQRQALGGQQAGRRQPGRGGPCPRARGRAASRPVPPRRRGARFPHRPGAVPADTGRRPPPSRPGSRSVAPASAPSPRRQSPSPTPAARSAPRRGPRAHAAPRSPAWRFRRPGRATAPGPAGSNCARRRPPAWHRRCSYQCLQAIGAAWIRLCRAIAAPLEGSAPALGVVLLSATSPPHRVRIGPRGPARARRAPRPAWAARWAAPLASNSKPVRSRTSARLACGCHDCRASRPSRLMNTAIGVTTP